MFIASVCDLIPRTGAIRGGMTEEEVVGIMLEHQVIVIGIVARKTGEISAGEVGAEVEIERERECRRRRR